MGSIRANVLMIVAALSLSLGILATPTAQRGNVPVVPIPPTGGMAKFAIGTSSDPSISFAANKFDGFYWSSAGHIVYTSQGNQCCDFGTGVTLNNTYAFGWANNASPAGGSGLDTRFIRAGAGIVAAGTASTIGSTINVSALPTVSSGFGTSPAIVAGSTPFSGSINVGTGAPGTGGIINYNGTAFPVAPFPVCMNQTTLMTLRCTSTTTQLTITTTALTASDIVNWVVSGPR